MQKYYKVLAIRNKKLYSWATNWALPKGSWIRYKVNQTTWPKITNSKLFVFDNLQKAIKEVGFWNDTTKVRIYECEVANPILCRNNVSFAVDLCDIINFWLYSTSAYKVVPDGTYLCDAVKITKRVF